MTMNASQRVLQLEELFGATIDPSRVEPEHLLSMCNDIEHLSKRATSVNEMDLVLRSLEIASSFMDHNNDQNQDVWKKNLSDLVDGLKAEVFVGMSECNWKNIEKHFIGIIPAPVAIPFLYNGVRTNGLMTEVEREDSLVKSQKARSKKIPQNNMILTKPLQVLGQTSSADSYKSKMQICLDRLYEVCNFDENVSVPFFNFAINCKSYLQTVHNIFTLSFLIREHLAVMSIDSDHVLWMRPAHKYQGKNQMSMISTQEIDYDSTGQLIISITPMEWKMLTRALGLTSSMLPRLWPPSDILKSNYEIIKSSVQFVE